MRKLRTPVIHSEPIEAYVQDLLHAQGLDYGLKPIPIVAVCHTLGISHVLSTPFRDGSIAGILLRHSPSNVTIYVNPYETVVRQRFIIAHVLGHWVLSPDLITLTQSIVDSDDHIVEGVVPSPPNNRTLASAEHAANAFAAAILMPRRPLHELSPLLTPEFLAKIYAVSPAVIHQRIRAI